MGQIDNFVSDMTIVGERELAIRMLKTLNDWGYFTKPASRKYHGDYEGGLFMHSRAVAYILARITSNCDIEWQNPRSPFIVGFFHDLCKCDAHKNIKGHGQRSVELARMFCELTEEEELCIRYHMGAYETDDWQGFDEAIKKYETVLWTHHADMIASKVVGA